ncbi:MAG TPA: hypothetical protein DCR93_11840 [Cytophagales bacterium]|nr:hypothetical protein [Cytophagales bacterium]
MMNAMACTNEPVTPPVFGDVTPVNINSEGFELLESMQGHWVGTNQVLSWEWDWFAFDYRAISPSHVFGIYEGGTMGNLLTSFFVTDFGGTRTIMARNGGVLSGIYRTSYFVLDSVRTEDGENYYRLVDAVGGAATMYMELSFRGNELAWNAYTSRLGENAMPTRHFSFRGSRQSNELASAAAQAVGFPQNESAWDFSDGFRVDYLYELPEEGIAKSASFLAQADNNDVFSLANQSGDPFRIQDHPRMGTLQVDIDRNAAIQEDQLFIYLSSEPLTDGSGYLVTEAFDSVLLFPDITGAENAFQFTYLHPGDYYLTVIADRNGDGFPGTGDITHPSERITIEPEGNHQISIANITVQN